MCFRPAEVTAPQVCPICGKEIAVIAGIKQKQCPFCNADLPEKKMKAPAPGIASIPQNKPPVPAALKQPAAPAVNRATSTPSAPIISSPSASNTEKKTFRPGHFNTD